MSLKCREQYKLVDENPVCDKKHTQKLGETDTVIVVVVIVARSAHYLTQCEPVKQQWQNIKFNDGYIIFISPDTKLIIVSPCFSFIICSGCGCECVRVCVCVSLGVCVCVWEAIMDQHNIQVFLFVVHLFRRNIFFAVCYFGFPSRRCWIRCFTVCLPWGSSKFMFMFTCDDCLINSFVFSPLLFECSIEEIVCKLVSQCFTHNSCVWTVTKAVLTLNCIFHGILPFH